MSLKDFDAARRERQRDREPVQFTLGGETFTLPAVLPLGLVFDLIEGQGDGSNPMAAMVASRKFLGDAVGDDRERFEAVLTSTTDPVEIEDLVAVVNWVAEEYTGRPTERSPESSGGPQTNGTSSTPTSSDTEGQGSPASVPGS